MQTAIEASRKDPDDDTENTINEYLWHIMHGNPDIVEAMCRENLFFVDRYGIDSNGVANMINALRDADDDGDLYSLEAFVMHDMPDVILELLDEIDPLVKEAVELTKLFRHYHSRTIYVTIGRDEIAIERERSDAVRQNYSGSEEFAKWIPA